MFLTNVDVHIMVVCFIPQLVGAYPVVSRGLRDFYSGKPAPTSQHCCGAAMHEQGLGYPDLDTLLKKPQQLEFIIGESL